LLDPNFYPLRVTDVIVQLIFQLEPLALAKSEPSRAMHLETGLAHIGPWTV
jgi:hypothetical protein